MSGSSARSSRLGSTQEEPDLVGAIRQLPKKRRHLPRYSTSEEKIQPTERKRPELSRRLLQSGSSDEEIPPRSVELLSRPESPALSDQGDPLPTLAPNTEILSKISESFSKRKRGMRARKTLRLQAENTQSSKIELPLTVPATSMEESTAAQKEPTHTKHSRVNTVKAPVIRNYNSEASFRAGNERLGIVKLNGKGWKSTVLQTEGTWVECVECKKWRYLKNVAGKRFQ